MDAIGTGDASGDNVVIYADVDSTSNVKSICISVLVLLLVTMVLLVL